MPYFKLPDLGEGLTEAEIVEWHVKEGETVKEDQPLVSVETAKAIVEIPSPQAGQVVSLFGQANDLVHTGEPLVEFAGDNADSGTVVGDLSAKASSPQADDFVIGAAPSTRRYHQLRASAAVSQLAERLGIDLTTLQPRDDQTRISAEDVERAAHLNKTLGDAEPLRGVRRAMANNMAQAHAAVAPVTLVEDVDIHRWPKHTDITMRLVHAIGAACAASPSLNAWFDGDNLSRRLLKPIDLAIAVDTEDGLFVPVLRDIGTRKLDDLRQGLDALRADVKRRTIPPREMTGATLTLSNFGTIAGRYATPMIVPPTVAIVGAGVIRKEPRVVKDSIKARRVLPLSLTIDHRVITGGEAARFLKALIEDLSKKKID